MPVLENQNNYIETIDRTDIQNKPASVEYNHLPTGGIQLNYFDLLDETPDFSEAAILLEDDVIEYCYVKNGDDGKQYFGFDHCLPGSGEYRQILSRHKLVNKMEANTFESYPSGKTVLSRRGKILEVSSPKQGGTHV